jgi:microcystin-dependent protein
MSDPFLGEIRLVGFSFAPQGWAFCDGQLLSISQNTALFSLLGTYYGGDGVNTFALPDLRGRVPVNQGQGPGLSSYNIGQSTGAEWVTLITSQIPAHSHAVSANSTSGSVENPIGNFTAAITDPNSGASINAFASTSNGTMNQGVIGLAGGNQPHPNLQPLLCVNFIIAVQGIYPSRN